MIKGALEDKFVYDEFKKLINSHKINKIIETGTYHGWSTKKLSEFGVNVFSIEISEENFEIAKKNISEEKINNVEIILGSSPKILEKIIDYNEENLLVFLDAHWHNYWPIHDELNVFIEKKIKPIIIIHDFYVPDENGKPKFGFDRYGEQNLDFKYIESFINKIYNEDGYNFHYNNKIDCVDSGLIYIYPKI
jgi:predicted O-methyltransferase YrrM